MTTESKDKATEQTTEAEAKTEAKADDKAKADDREFSYSGGEQQGGADDYNAQSASREAAKYRRRLREAEAERDKLAARVDAADRREVERQVTGTGGLADAADFWLAGVSLDDLRDDDGNLDTEKVDEARKRVLSEHPSWRHQPTPNFDGGARESAIEDRTPSFGQAMKRAVRG